MKTGIWAAAIVVSLLLTQTVQAGPGYLFRIKFTDKAGAPSLKEAGSFLSARALARRTAQGIALDEKDIPVSPVYLHEITERTRGRIQNTSRWLNSCVLAVGDSLEIIRLQGLPFVLSTECVGYTSAQVRSAGKKFNSGILHTPVLKTTGNPAFYGSTWTQTSLVNGDCLHDKGLKGQSKLVAVLDDGFHYVNTQVAFDSVYLNGKIVDTRNFVNGGTDVYTDFLTHGTQVFSTIAANLPNIYVGAATGAQFALYATEYGPNEWPVEMDNMVAAFERADSIGADIISTSTGYNNFDPPFQTQSITPAQMDGKTTVAAIGVNVAAQKGMLVVVTAGNEGSAGLLTPGDADSALTVGNVNTSKVPASNSGYGPNAAGHIKPEVCALGQPGYVITTGSTPFGVSGTSISTPQVAGFAACLWQGSVGKTNAQIKRAIIASSHLYPNPQMPQLGYGVPDFCKADVIAGVTETATGTMSLTVSPNPFSEVVHLTMRTEKAGAASITVTAITGQVIFSEETVLKPGNNTLTISLPASVSGGIYVCQALFEGKIRHLKLVKK